MPQQSAAEYGGLGRSLYFLTFICETHPGITAAGAGAAITGFNNDTFLERFLLHLFVEPQKHWSGLQFSLDLNEAQLLVCGFFNETIAGTGAFLPILFLLHRFVVPHMQFIGSQSSLIFLDEQFTDINYYIKWQEN